MVQSKQNKIPRINRDVALMFSQSPNQEFPFKTRKKIGGRIKARVVQKMEPRKLQTKTTSGT
jgi:hypothetical protein